MELRPEHARYEALIPKFQWLRLITYSQSRRIDRRIKDYVRSVWIAEYEEEQRRNAAAAVAAAADTEARATAYRAARGPAAPAAASVGRAST